MKNKIAVKIGDSCTKDVQICKSQKERQVAVMNARLTKMKLEHRSNVVRTLISNQRKNRLK